MFRPAVISDAPFIVDLLREFYKRFEHFGIPFDDRSTRRYVLNLLRTGICLVGPTSCAAATLSPFIWNENAIVAHICFWYFKRSREVAIFRAMVDVCKRSGATHLTASSHYPANAIARLYDKFSLQPCEIVHLLPL